jgi:hypothetical protein
MMTVQFAIANEKTTRDEVVRLNINKDINNKVTQSHMNLKKS